jgi:hypothetical protein
MAGASPHTNGTLLRTIDDTRARFGRLWSAIDTARPANETIRRIEAFIQLTTRHRCQELSILANAKATTRTDVVRKLNSDATGSERTATLEAARRIIGRSHRADTGVETPSLSANTVPIPIERATQTTNDTPIRHLRTLVRAELVHPCTSMIGKRLTVSLGRENVSARPNQCALTSGGIGSAGIWIDTDIGRRCTGGGWL